jgi:hypothetical protein
MRSDFAERGFRLAAMLAAHTSIRHKSNPIGGDKAPAVPPTIQGPRSGGIWKSQGMTVAARRGDRLALVTFVLPSLPRESANSKTRSYPCTRDGSIRGGDHTPAAPSV